MKRHKGKKRKKRKRILILCEGVTEKNYFQAIKEDPSYKQALLAISPRVIKAKNPTPEQVVKEAKKLAKAAEKEANPYDRIWLVFDHDNHAHRETAFHDAIKAAFNVAFSAICFEMWYLLHFVKTKRAFPKGEALIKELKKHYPGYEKAKQNDFANLKENLPAALKNAKWLRNQAKKEEESIPHHNPWTDVDVLVLELIEKNNQG